MIINDKFKYIFIGIPFSASSAISKELIELYDGSPLLHKHANIPYLLKMMPQLDISSYNVFAVARDPIEMAFSVYNKMLTNAYDVYTKPNFFIENGGFVKPRAREIFKELHGESWSFNDYISSVYNIIPYDSYLSENKPYLSQVIDFSELQNGFNEFLENVGLPKKRELPVYNKTVKDSDNMYLHPDVKKKAFGPFLEYNKVFYRSLDLGSIPLSSMFKFKIFRLIKSYRWMKIDRRLGQHDISMID